MQVSRYQPSYHDILIMLHETHGRSINTDDLPLIGFICMEGSIPVATAFLRPTRAYGMVEHLVTNNDLPRDMQAEGRGLVIKALVEVANSLNIKTIY